MIRGTVLPLVLITTEGEPHLTFQCQSEAGSPNGMVHDREGMDVCPQLNSVRQSRFV